MVQSTPIKVSKPQAITVANLTQSQIQTLIQENPTRPSILRPSEQFLPPSIPLYLPDPERNKSKDDYYLLATYQHDENEKSSSNESPIKLNLPLDPYIQAPPPPALDDESLAHQLEQAEKDKQSYSYNNRFDYYFPVHVVYDENQKYADKELQLMELQPPNKNNDEPNYYAVKPKKVPKKYQPNKKESSNTDKPNQNDEDNDEGLVPIDNDGLVLADEHSYVTSQPVERFAPAPSLRQLTDDDLNTGEYIPKYKQHQDANTESISLIDSTVPSVSLAAAGSEHKARRQSGESFTTNSHDSRIRTNVDYDDQNSSETDNDTDKRVEFQMHGFKGPNSYKFGYDTGLG